MEYPMPIHQIHTQEETKPLCKGADRLYLPLLTLLFAVIALIIYRQLNAPEIPEQLSALDEWLIKDALAFLLFGIALLLLLWQVSFALRYKAFQRAPVSELPTVTVVIPAYNEGMQILETVRSVMASDYPSDRVEVICVDDGSQDDTWKWICRAQEAFPANVTIHKQPYNQGKRCALILGFTEAKGEVIVTLDSDSEVLPDTLAELVSPFVHDKRIGSVAGNVRVLNLKEGIIPKMLEVSFTSAFDYIRAGQSVYGGVFCTPGALSAYRTAVLKRVCDEWSGQTFMGKPATIGEDRALTNLVLAAGHRVVYQRNAVVLTKVPTRFHGLRKMLTRWARSNVRESLVMFTYVFRRFRASGEGANWIRLFSLTQMVRMTLFEALKCALLLAVVMNADVTLFVIALGCLSASLIPGSVYLLRHRSLFGFRWAAPFAFFWLLCLSWIPFWGMLTASNSGWLTRTMPKEQPMLTTSQLVEEPASQLPTV
jgi:hyaluronan synthase